MVFLYKKWIHLSLLAVLFSPIEANAQIDQFLENQGRKIAFVAHPTARFVASYASVNSEKAQLRIEYQSRWTNRHLSLLLSFHLSNNQFSSLKVVYDEAMVPPFLAISMARDALADSIISTREKSPGKRFTAKALLEVVKAAPIKTALCMYLNFKFERSSAYVSNTREVQYNNQVAYNSAPVRTVYRTEIEQLAHDCFQGVREACITSSHRYSNAVGVERDAELAVRLRRKGCELEIPVACNDLGFMYARGKGVSKDIKRASEYYLRACEYDFPTACSNLGWTYYSGFGVGGHDYQKAKRCNNTQTVGCRGLGILYEHGLGVSQNSYKASTLLERCCVGGNKIACRWMRNGFPSSPR